MDDAADSVDETAAAQGRLPDRTYVSRGFTNPLPGSRDVGEPARFVYKVFDDPDETAVERDGEVYTVRDADGGRFQVKICVVREAGNIRDLWVQRVPATGRPDKVRNVLHLRREDAMRLVEVLRNLDLIEVSTAAETVRVDDSLVRDLFANPESLVSIYREDPDRFRQLITDDASARDVVAVARRRAQVDQFRRFLDDDAYFDAQIPRGRGPEAVWQRFLEDNPWILGVSLTGQLVTSWNAERLEQVVVGSSVSGPGKRADALLRTAGRIRSMVFAEIKHHRTRLLAEQYRPGCWSPSRELAGGVAQVHGTVQRATASIGTRLPDLAPDGSELPAEFTYLLRPHSYLVVGRLEEFVGQSGGHHQDRIQSFELYRRHLQEPEIITFDELLARAEWLVDAGGSPEPVAE